MDSIDYYNKYAAKEFEETVNQDMSEIMREFLNYLEEGDTILDLGCGSGRDSLTLYELGYDVTPSMHLLRCVSWRKFTRVLMYYR